VPHPTAAIPRSNAVSNSSSTIVWIIPRIRTRIFASMMSAHHSTSSPPTAFLLSLTIGVILLCSPAKRVRVFLQLTRSMMTPFPFFHQLRDTTRNFVVSLVCCQRAGKRPRIGGGAVGCMPLRLTSLGENWIAAPLPDRPKSPNSRQGRKVEPELRKVGSGPKRKWVKVMNQYAELSSGGSLECSKCSR